MTDCLISNFEIIRPEFQSTQEHGLDWLVTAHTKAEQIKSKDSLTKAELDQFSLQLKEKLWHVGCKPDVIAFRGHSISDFTHTDWDAMQIYRLNDSPEGVGLRQRAKVFDTIVSAVIEQFYPVDSTPPDDLIHVSCTGYNAPSGIQKTVSKRSWGEKCTVTHAYHMGCYATLPAVRIASGFLAARDRTIDIVHTELCTLHNNPTHHALDQLVAHSLFADGFIKYSVSSKKNQSPSLRLLIVHEEIIPNSLEAMLWSLSDWGFEFTLAREIPVLIVRALKKYIGHLCTKAGIAEKDLLEHALFAIHPGGPKILKYIQELLGLRDDQVCYSHSILREHGNMSSATLPHVWEKIVNDAKIPSGTKIVSLAFGPGLTIAGSLMEKEI